MNVRRPEGREDVRGTIRAHGRAWRDAYADILPAGFLQQLTVDPTPEDVDRWVEGLGENPEGVFVAVDDGTVLGFADVRWGDVETKEFVGEREAELKAIYVDPDAWGRGIGTALLERGLDALPEHVETLRLEVLSENEVGRRFYEARGFERTGSGEYEIADEPYPTDIYSLSL